MHAFTEAPIYRCAPPRPSGFVGRLWSRLALRIVRAVEVEQLGAAGEHPPGTIRYLPRPDPSRALPRRPGRHR